MKGTLLTAFRAVRAIRNYDQLRNGVTVALPGLGPVEFRLALIEASPRGDGYRLPEHTYRAEVTSSQGIIGYGYGEDSFKLIAIQKAVSEALERSVYKTVKPTQNLISSNGWACNYDLARAKKSAAFELLERHTVLSAWLEEKSFSIFENPLWPEWLIQFQNDELSKAKEFTRLSVLISPNQSAPVATVAIQNNNGNGFISHAADDDFERAIKKALIEVCRIISFYEEDKLEAEFSNILVMPSTPWEHAVAYARHRKLPKELFGQTISEAELNEHWQKSQKNFERQFKELSFETINVGAFSVVRAKSNFVQDLFFGEGTSKINLRSGIRPSPNRIKEPHIVP